MKIKLQILSILVVSLIGVSSCEHSTQNNNNKIQTLDSIPNSSMEIKYAQNFSVEYFDTHKKITVLNPWKSQKVFWEYFLVKDSSFLKENTRNQFYIYDNLNSTAVLSSPILSMLEELSSIHKIAAVADKNYIYNSEIITKIEKGEISEIGGYDRFNSEKCFLLKIDALFTTGWDKADETFTKISQVGIPVIYSLDWQENTPLGRAEWIKFISAFLGQEELANQYFSDVENKYLNLKKLAKKTKSAPSVFNGNLQGDSWFVSGGDSYLAHYFSDANANYIFQDRKSTGSIPLSLEAVYNACSEADFWIASANSTTENFTSKDERYQMFSAYQKKQIFVSSARINEYGGNDYWESAIIHPELQLQDFIQIFHPNLLETKELVYYKNLLKQE